ncbi:transporter substrate-binding domain-containing protein [Massilia sp. PAMC28688]|nr:transporter substrate-binding domain-containing protein [Massilia sp. PAMC28688]
MTSHLPPLSVEHDAGRPGALYELVAELCRRTGRTLQAQFVPWKRAIHLASSNRATAIFPLTRTPGRERHFRWLVSLYDEHYVFLTPRGRAFDVRNPENMKDMRISLIRGSSLTESLVQMGYRNIVEARSVDEVHRFLVAGIADAAFGERNIVRNSLRSRAALDEFDVSEPVRRTSAWLAGSLDFTESDAAGFERAMLAMKADGTHQAILKRYQLG